MINYLIYINSGVIIMEFENVVYRNDSEPVCERGDCFANREGRCEILTDNDFGKRECPFYKPRKSVGSE